MIAAREGGTDSAHNSGQGNLHGTRCSNAPHSSPASWLESFGIMWLLRVFTKPMVAKHMEETNRVPPMQSETQITLATGIGLPFTAKSPMKVLVGMTCHSWLSKKHPGNVNNTERKHRNSAETQYRRTVRAAA